VSNGTFGNQDYYDALAGIVIATARDSAEKREAIYEIARSKLRQQLDRRADALSPSERSRQLLAFEAAIEQIENELRESVTHEMSSSVKTIAPVIYPSIEIIPPPARHPRSLYGAAYEVPATSKARPMATLMRSTLMLAIAATFGAVAYVGVQRDLHWGSQPQSEAGQNVPQDAIVPSSRPSVPIISALLPTPTVFGVYAVINGQLIELQQLPIRLPDARVAISGTISSPSTTKLANGRAQFVVFRRDLVNNAPEKVAVRVVAQVKPGSETAGNGGTTTGSDPLWVVRGISYPMKVAPLHGNPAMILIHPADPDFSFPAGRYALALKSVAYDFSVDGPITDLAQCLERKDDTSEPLYTQCAR
jgi:hypothetical protein